LDRPVSGIILFAKQKSVLRNLSEQFAERRVRKFYQALTDKDTRQTKGILENWHRKEKKKAILADEEFPYAEKALLEYEVKQQASDRYLWNIELHTGKYHQIRAQLAKIGCPIVGDSLYGSTISYHPDAIALHASKLIFHHPVSNEETKIESKRSF
jgi:23S rRNA-/tRNA-specific pseudouridylate synthase